MLVKLLAEQIAYRWNTIKYALNDALPPTAARTPEAFNKILEKLLNGEMHCWLACEGSEAKAIVATAFTEDFSGPRSLLVYSFTRIGTDEVGFMEFKEVFETLKKFALSKDCTAICYYTALEGFVRLAEKLGGDADYRYAVIPINRGDSNEDL